MSSVRLNLTHRPIKLGFMVRPGNRQDSELAIQLSSSMWGGAYNPLIPEVKRVAGIWKEPYSMPGSGSEIVQGYIRYFDPDFLVTKSPPTFDSKWDVIRGTISYEEIFHEYHSEKTLNYGVSIFELAEYILKSELKYTRRHPLKFVFPKFSKRDSLFFSALFGALPKDIEDRFINYFGKALEIEKKPCNLYNFTEFLDPNNLYIRRILDVGIRKHNVRGKLITFFLLNSRDTQDVIDFWNLRASGKNIVPLPIESLKDDILFEYVFDTLKHYNIVGNTNVEYYRIPNFIKARSLKKSDLDKFERALVEMVSKKTISRPQIQIQSWYPRLWDTSNIEYNFGECSDFEHSKNSLSLNSIPEKLTFSTSQLSVMDDSFIQAHYKYATDVEYRIYGGNTLYAEVIPEIKNSLARELGSIDNENWRFSPNGVVHYCHLTEWQNELNVPTSESVFKKWLKEKGWEAELSVAGKAGMQLLRQLGGVGGINLIRNKRILEMLDEMSGNRYKFAKEVLDIAQKIHEDRPFKIGKSERIVHHLVKSSALSLGASIQCEVCGERSWYSLADVNYKLRCPRCTSEFEPPFSAPGKMKWAYKTIGAYNSGNQANGMYTVLFTLAFFSESQNLSTTSFLSFNASSGKNKIEADLAILFRKESYGWKKRDPKILFAECKSFDDFKEEDFKRMGLLGKQFPGSYLVFSTLKDDLSAFEKKNLKVLSNSFRRIQPNYSIRNYLIILTGEQLLSRHWPPKSWTEKGGKFASAGKIRGDNIVDGISDITQQVFLDMEPLDVYIQREVEKRGNRKKKQTPKPINSPPQTEEASKAIA